MIHTRSLIGAAATCAMILLAACKDKSEPEKPGSGAASPPSSSAAAATSKGSEPAAGGRKTLHGALLLNVPAAAEVSDDGSVFGPGKVELAVYAEDSVKTPHPDVASRKKIIEGRSTVKSYGATENLPDGWVVLFQSDKGLGFECGRVLGGKCYVFWGDSSPDEATRTQAVDVCKTSRTP